jgi:glycosyltransferase involved in cell wall biosynthesis
MRVCLVYDCLYPYTVGGAERWYRNLAERLVADGHEVTYLTLRQWERGERLELDPRIRVLTVGPRMALYTSPPASGPAGRRRILPPLVFGAGVLWHLLRHGRRYDVVHTCAFPYFSLLAAALVRPLARYGLVADWFEVWSRDYWRLYLGGVGGRAGELVQRLCARVPQRAFCFSQLHAKRLREQGLRGPITILRGLYAGSTTPAAPREADMRRALCVLLPSEREGYGMVVVEASAHATPSVVVAAPDNGAVELVADGVNGLVADNADHETIADAIVRVHEAGMEMRESTARWFEENAESLSLESSLRAVLARYDSARR